MRQLRVLLLAGALLLAACGTSPAGLASAPTSAPTVPAPTAATLPAGGVVLASGEFSIPASVGFGVPGSHDVLTASGTTPADLATTAGMRLVIELRDVSRPELKCTSEHPLGGCATVDWSDFPERPKVPESGVFDNHITLRLASGERTFYLSEQNRLADKPDAYAPG